MKASKTSDAISHTLLALFCVVPSLCAASRIVAEHPIQIERPLIDPAITFQDGVYYLTGTVGGKKADGSVDFDHNEGVFLWKSSDCEKWKDMGVLWRFDSFGGAENFYSLGQHQPAQFKPGGSGHAVTAPRLHRIEGQGRWVVSLAKNRSHIHLLFGDKGIDGPFLPPLVNASWKGPFRHKFTTHGPTGQNRALVESNSAEGKMLSPLSFLLQDDGDLFQENGTVYLVWADGWIVPLTPELDGRAAEPINLLTTIPGWPERPCPLECTTPTSASLFKHDGVYHLVFAAYTKRDGKAHHDTLVSRSSQLMGPYSVPELLIPDAAPARLFADGDKVRATAARNGSPYLFDIEFAK